MTTTEILFTSLVVFGTVALVGIFWTKTKGFGKYTTCLLLLTLVLITASLFFAADKIESAVFANIAFAVAGFAGGLITGNKEPL